jgi:hypothetical protein
VSIWCSRATKAKDGYFASLKAERSISSSPFWTAHGATESVYSAAMLETANRSAGLSGAADILLRRIARCRERMPGPV